MLSNNLSKLHERNEILELKILESEFKYKEIYNKLFSSQKNIKSEAPVKGVEKVNLEFQRKLSTFLDKENKALKEEIEFLNAKIAELENRAQNSSESEFVNELLNMVGANSREELVKKIYMMKEIQIKMSEQRKLVKKITDFVIKNTGKNQVSCDDIWKFITEGNN